MTTDAEREVNRAAARLAGVVSAYLADPDLSAEYVRGEMQRKLDEYHQAHRRLVLGDEARA